MNPTLRTLACAFFCLLIAAPLSAQPYPAKPVRIVVPFAPGGGSDFIGRFIAQKLSERLGQQFVVDNRPGAGGNLGAEMAVKSAGDGYTLLLIAGSYTANPSLYKLGYDPINDISPIIQLSQGPFVVAVHPGVPAKNLRDLLELARKQPDKLSYASAGQGSITHLASELFLDMAQLRIVHVPYKGTGPALNDAIAGNVQLLFGSVATTLQHIKSGRLRGLAVTTAKRSAVLPDVPAVAETLKGFEIDTWWGLVAPAGTPADVVAKLNAAFVAALNSPEAKARFASLMAEPVASSPEQFGAFMKSELGKYEKVVKASGAKVD
jgi:tripartite-type tricarboxylate transporter receptor subunit TctC